MKEIMLQSMRGLHHMHTRDFIHMDLKPENIGVTWRKNSVRCCILDLGSAVTFSDLQIGDIIHTTREYTSPEMLRGIVTFAVDIFSMGRILNHLIDRLSTSSACCLNIMRTLSEDMTLKEHTDRPTSKAVLIRLDDDMTPLLCTARELVWNSIAGNLCDGDASRLVNDTSAHLHKMVSLIRCDSVEMVETGLAFAGTGSSRGRGESDWTVIGVGSALFSSAHWRQPHGGLFLCAHRRAIELHALLCSRGRDSILALDPCSVSRVSKLGFASLGQSYLGGVAAVVCGSAMGGAKIAFYGFYCGYYQQGRGKHVPRGGTALAGDCCLNVMNEGGSCAAPEDIL